MTTLDTLHEVTKGRPYVLVVMAYKDAKTKADKRAKVFELVRNVVEQEFGLACVRADHFLNSGHELLDKIHMLIDRASLVIGEISEPRPNVFYELGYAMGIKKTPVLLIEAGLRPPYDLQGREVFEYENTMDGVDAFVGKLTQHLRIRLKSELPLLREMLAPPRPAPSYIVASPKYPGENSRIQGQVYDSRTFGDHVGILGLVSAFGSFYGDAKGIELISAQHAHPELLNQDVNLCLIGSVKVNPWSSEILKRLSERGPVQWRFEPAPGWTEGMKGDWPVALYREENGKMVPKCGELVRVAECPSDGNSSASESSAPGDWTEKGWIWSSDYGIIVRGPHPVHPGRLVLVMAGAHSLGTAAACLAATRTSVIERLRAMLPHGVMADKSRTFWALVKGSASSDHLLDEEGVTIEEVGVYS